MEDTHPGGSARRLLLILRRRWKLLALAWTGTLAGTAIFTFTSTRLYRPQATIEIRPEVPLISTGVQDPTLTASQTLWQNYYKTQKSILSSRTLLERTIAVLPPAISREYAANYRTLADQLDIDEERASFIMKVGVVDRDPEKATQIVNTLVGEYILESNRRLREVKSTAGEILSKKTLPEIRRKVEDADKALQDIQAKTGFVDPEEHYKSLLTSRAKITAALTETKLRRAKVKAEFSALSGYGSDGVGGLFHPGFHKTRYLEELGRERIRIGEELARAAKELKGKHPKVLELEGELRAIEAKIKEAVKGVLAAMQTDLRAAEAEEKELGDELDAVDKKLAEVGLARNRFRRLDAELTAAREIYASYLKMQGETSATSGTGLVSIRVLDYAKVPKEPYKPKVALNLALGAILGLMLGIGIMMVTNLLDNRILSHEDLEAFLGVDVLAVVPRLKEGGERPVLLGGDSSLAEFEAFRKLRAEIATRLEKVSGCRMVAVTSAVADEGKTTVATNLARALAMEGWRVLIVDADLRKPSMVALLSAGEGEIERLLRGDRTLEGAVRRTSLERVDLLGARDATSAAAELLSSPRFEAALREAKERYDIILLDTPPVIAAAETPLVARRADGVVLVVRGSRTGRGEVAAARKRLLSAEAKLLGAVLNAADPGEGGYGYYYYGGGKD